MRILRALLLALLVCGVLAAGLPTATAEDLAQGFARPPDSARPWVYWFWLNGNIAREGITADLEAMQRVGIGGEVRRKHLDGDVAAEARIPGPIDLAHSAFAQLPEDSPWPKHLASHDRALFWASA